MQFGMNVLNADNEMVVDTIQRNLNDLPFDSISKHLSLLVKELLNVVLWETRDEGKILCIR